MSGAIPRYDTHDTNELFDSPDGNWILHADHLNAMQAKDAEIGKLQDDLIHIGEYWNRNQHNTAMEEALWHIIEVAEKYVPKEVPMPDETKECTQCGCGRDYPDRTAGELCVPCQLDAALDTVNGLNAELARLRIEVVEEGGGK